MILKNYGLKVAILCDDHLTRQLLEQYLNGQHGGGAFKVTHSFGSIKEALKHDWSSTDVLFIRHARMNVRSALRFTFLEQLVQQNPALIIVSTNSAPNLHQLMQTVFPELFFISFSELNFSQINVQLVETVLIAAQVNGVLARKTNGRFNVLLAVAEETQKLTIPHLFSELVESPLHILAIADSSAETNRLLDVEPSIIDCLIISRRLVVMPGDNRCSWAGVRDLCVKADRLTIPAIILGELPDEQRAECPKAIVFPDPYSLSQLRERVLALATA